MPALLAEGLAPGEDEPVPAEFTHAVEAYRAGRFAEALRGFEALAARDDGWLLAPEARLDRALAMAGLGPARGGAPHAAAHRRQPVPGGGGSGPGAGGIAPGSERLVKPSAQDRKLAFPDLLAPVTLPGAGDPLQSWRWRTGADATPGW